MKWKAITGALCSLVTSALFAQAQAPIQLLPQNQAPHATCFSDEIYQHRLLLDPQLSQRTSQVNDAVRNYLKAKGNAIEKNGSLTIPVAVYIVHNNGPENISDNQVISQINAMNNYFDPYGIQFCLATMNGSTPLTGTNTPGIMRVQSAAYTDLDANTEHASLAALSTLSSNKFLRIWVVSNINNGTVAGFSYLPDAAPSNVDGIVMDYNAFGDVATCGCSTLSPNSDDGKILIHEVGHYLGLYHTFNGGCAGMNSSTCDTQGDLVCDTPPVASPNSGCNAINSCNESPDLPDHINNYMDYTSENCLNSFTNGQNARMHAMISLYRSNLVSPANHTYTGINCTGGLLPGFTASTFSPCTGTAVTFSAYPVSGVTYSWDFGDGTTATGQNVTHTYASVLTPGAVTLTISNSSGSASTVQTIFVENCTSISSSEAHWYFYNRNALDFSTGAPVFDNSAFTNNTMAASGQNGVHELAAVQSDANGNLLFYTDGTRIWNASHQVITAALHGDYSSMNGTMIVPDPGNANLYYVFTSDVRGGQRGFKYTKVQVSGTTATLVPGQLNVPVTVPSGLGLQVSSTNALITGEGISAARHSSGYWILASTIVNNIQQRIVAFNLTASGLAWQGSTVVGNLQTTVTNTHVGAIGLQVSPDGRRVAFNSGVWNAEPDYVFDFDLCSATFSNKRSLSNLNLYGMEFSPDSRLLYGTNYTDLIQFNLEPCTVQQQIVGTLASPNGYLAGLQRGPDGKIYGLLSQEDHMIVIHRPNNLATASGPNACMYSFNGPTFGNGMTATFGLPNFIDANKAPVYTNVITASVNQCSASCNTFKFSGGVCASSYSWNFGDPASGSANTSTLAYPSHTFSAAGTYTVTLTAGGVTTTTTVTTGTAPSITGSLTICPSVSMTGNYNTVIPAGYTALWTASNGTISGLNNQSDVSIIWSSLPGSVTVTLTNTATGCTSQKTISVTQYCAPVSCVCNVNASFNYSVSKACKYTFSGSYNGPTCAGTATYSWDFGDGQTATGTNPMHVYSNPGTYTVCVTVTYVASGQVCSDTYCKNITVTCKPKCDCKNMQPTFTYQKDNDCVYQFSGVSGATACEAYTEYYWDFGDGNTSMGQNAAHAYANPGDYDVCLKVVVYNEYGEIICTDGYCEKVTIDCAGKCECKIQPYFTMVNNGSCKMTFTGYSGSSCTDIDAFEWYVNGSGPYNGQHFNYQFDVNTQYDICFRVLAHTGDQYCEEKACESYFYTDCYPFVTKTAGSTPVISLFPNPASNQLTLSYASEQPDELKVVLRLADGRKVKETTYAARGGEQQFKLDIPESVANGFVFVEITGANGTYLEKVMILRN